MAASQIIEHMSGNWIRASEITTYVYCRRSWWLQRVARYTADNIHEMQTGTEYHEDHGRTVQQSTWAQRLAYVLIFVTIGVIVFTVLMSAGI